MKFTPQQIKKAILHPERRVRDLALDYFDSPEPKDDSYMAIAIEAMERYGRKSAFTRLTPLIHFPQNRESIEWILGELQGDRESAQNDPYNYFQSLSRVLSHADPSLIAPVSQAIFEAPLFSSLEVKPLKNHLKIATWDPSKCWSELELFSAKIKKKHPEVDLVTFIFRYGFQIVENLARKPDNIREKTVSFLKKKMKGRLSGTEEVMRFFYLKLAGLARLSEAIPILVKNLDHPSDPVSDSCMFALIDLHMDEVVNRVCRLYPEATEEFQMMASDLFSHLRLDSLIPWTLETLEWDDEPEHRLVLCHGLIEQFTSEAIEPSLELIHEMGDWRELLDLKSELSALCQALEIQVPEVESWRDELKEREEKELIGLQKLNDSLREIMEKHEFGP